MNKTSKKLSSLAQDKEELQANNSFKWLRSSEVRKLLNVGNSTLQVMREKGLIPAYQLGTMWFYREEDINNEILNSKKSINKSISL